MRRFLSAMLAVAALLLLANMVPIPPKALAQDADAPASEPADQPNDIDTNGTEPEDTTTETVREDGPSVGPDGTLRPTDHNPTQVREDQPEGEASAEPEDGELVIDNDDSQPHRLQEENANLRDGELVINNDADAKPHRLSEVPTDNNDTVVREDGQPHRLQEVNTNLRDGELVINNDADAKPHRLQEQNVTLRDGEVLIAQNNDDETPENPTDNNDTNVREEPADAPAEPEAEPQPVQQTPRSVVPRSLGHPRYVREYQGTDGTYVEFPRSWVGSQTTVREEYTPDDAEVVIGGNK